MKVEQFYAKNQFHLYGLGKDILQSYNSKVVEISYETTPSNLLIKLGRDWDYSTTTSKYVYLFLEEYGNVSFNGIANKKAYVNKLIKNNVIEYDEEMK